MSNLSETPSAERIRIVFFGRRNVGKSSLLNAVAGQPVSIVSDVPGTTADPVRKAMELLPLGPVLLVDTAGLDDDEATIGDLRVKRAREELRSADLGVIVTDPATGLGPLERALVKDFRDAGIAFVVAVNKIDAYASSDASVAAVRQAIAAPVYALSARTGDGVDAFRRALSETKIDEPESQRLVGDRLSPGDVVVLVTPIDGAAPKGRIILPQQMILRDVLDAHATAFVMQVPQLAQGLASLGTKPRMVITDSQAFAEVRAIVPQDIELTSFSILMARYKGDFDILRAGVAAVDGLRDGDRILVSEGCTHRRQCGDIGSVKIPAWLREFTGKDLVFDFTSGRDWPPRERLSAYRLIIHCGACMLPRREMRSRITDARAAGVPIVNYGLLLARLRGAG